MGHHASPHSKREDMQRARVRLRLLEHYTQVTRDGARTCRNFGVSWSQFYEWRSWFDEGRLEVLRPRKRGACGPHPNRISP